jgi:hypothetical protein
MRRNVPLHDHTGNRVAAVRLTAQLHEVQLSAALSTLDDDQGEVGEREVHIHLSTLRGLQEDDLSAREAFITCEFYRSQVVGNKHSHDGPSERNGDDLSYHDTVARARALHNLRTRLLRFTQQQLAMLTHHELPIGLDIAPFRLTAIPPIQQEMTSPCWKATLALQDACISGDRAVAEGAFVLPWRLVRECGEIEHVLLLRRTNGPVGQPDLRLSVRISVRPSPQQCCSPNATCSIGAVLLW